MIGGVASAVLLSLSRKTEFGQERNRPWCSRILGSMSQESTSLQVWIHTTNGLQLINMVLRHTTRAFKDFISNSAGNVKSNDCCTFWTTAFNSV